MKPTYCFTLSDLERELKNADVQHSGNKIRDKVDDLFDIFDIDKELFKNQVATDITYDEYREYTALRKYGRELLRTSDYGQIYSAKRIKLSHNAAYRFPGESFLFLFDWCKNHGKDADIFSLRNYEFNQIDYLVLKKYVDEICSMIDSVDVDETIKAKQKRRVYTRTQIELREKQQELMRFCKLLLYKLNLDEKMLDVCLHLESIPFQHKYYMYETSVLISTEDMKQFLNMVIADYKACMYRHDKILNLMIKKRSERLNEIFKQKMAPQYSRVDINVLSELAHAFRNEQVALMNERLQWQKLHCENEIEVKNNKTISEWLGIKDPDIFHDDNVRLYDFYGHNDNEEDENREEPDISLSWANWQQMIDDYVGEKESIELLEYVKNIVDTDVANQMLETNPFAMNDLENSIISPF